MQKYTEFDFNVGDDCIILKRPGSWASLCKDNNPFSVQINYPYRITIKAKKLDTESLTDYTGIACDYFGWDLTHLVNNNLIKKINKKKLKKI